MNRIYLVGYMGSGKTTIGHRLASELGWECIDLDVLITQRSGMSIPDIFFQQGEAIFRILEASALHRTFSLQNVVVATGGGTPCYYGNMKGMQEKGVTIYLKTSPEIIKERIEKDKTVRPILYNKSGNELADRIKNHLLERTKVYNKAEYIINAEEPVEDIVKSILVLIQK